MIFRTYSLGRERGFQINGAMWTQYYGILHTQAHPRNAVKQHYNAVPEQTILLGRLTITSSLHHPIPYRPQKNLYLQLRIEYGFRIKFIHELYR